MNRYNPYTPLSPALLEALLRQPMYFVRQQYPRGKEQDNDNRIPLLLTHYGHHDVDKERADRHMRLLFRDPYRFLYDSQDPAHADKLRRAAAQPEGFRIFVNLLPKKWKPGESLRGKIARFVREQLPCWNVHPSDKLSVTLKERYGELFIALLWKGRQMEVHLEEIENHGLCAMI